MGKWVQDADLRGSGRVGDGVGQGFVVRKYGGDGGLCRGLRGKEREGKERCVSCKSPDD